MKSIKPGRKLDALIADRVMGLGPLKKSPFHKDLFFPSAGGCPVWPYSLSITWAWEVVERMESLERPFSLNRQRDHWQAIFWDNRNDGNDPESIGEGKTPAHAICLAALDCFDSKGKMRRPK